MPLNVTYNASLKSLNTFGVAAKAWALVTIDRWMEVEDAVQFARQSKRPFLVMGSGSNMLFRRNFPGVAVQVHNRGRDIINDDSSGVTLRVAAGENWNELVYWTAREGLWGIENLALIPGLVGAAPIQNIGAYGVELSETLLELQCFDRQLDRWRTLANKDCEFGYRSSRFKDSDPERFVITEVVLRLTRSGQAKITYPGIRDALQHNDSSSADPNPLQMATAISNIRQSKLPDPAQTGNAGSFFKNPVVPESTCSALLQRFPELPCHKVAGHNGEQRQKLSAAWMIQHCGWRGKRRGDAGVSDQHALVLVNHGQASGEQLWQLARDIQTTVRQTFRVNLEPEPLII
ncbi:MAG: UDP-N-acetylmuramate dehydrogenase [Lysobacterales bacterium]